MKKGRNSGSPLVNYLLCIVCIFFMGCNSYIITAPMYPSISNEDKKSTLVIENSHNPSEMSFDRLRMAVYLDGFRITEHDILLKGTTSVDIMPGNHQVRIKAYPKGVIPMNNDVVFSFDSDYGKTYVVKILKGDKLWDPGYKLEYEGFIEDESETWPKSRYARSV